MDNRVSIEINESFQALIPPLADHEIERLEASLVANVHSKDVN